MAKVVKWVVVVTSRQDITGLYNKK